MGDCEVNLKTNPLDNIVAGDLFIVPEGQLRMAPAMHIFDTGELRIIDNGTLIFEE